MNLLANPNGANDARKERMDPERNGPAQQLGQRGQSGVAVEARVAGFTAEALKPGIDWLASEQGPAAKVSQFGIYTTIGDYCVSVTPSGKAGDNRGSVVIVNLREEAKRRENVHGYPELVNGITQLEREALEREVASLAFVLDRWNGHDVRHDSCSFRIDVEVGRGVTRAFSNYCARGLAADRERPRVTAPEGWR